jgi:hypothetical protein
VLLTRIKASREREEFGRGFRETVEVVAEIEFCGM